MNILNKAIKLKDNRKENFGKYNHIAIIVKKSVIISSGGNVANKTNTLSLKYGNKWSLHAEINAIAKGKKKDYNGCDMYVFRFGKRGLAMSRPCLGCMKALKDFKFDNVFYSVSNHERIIKEKIVK